jgi:hypothetical protein
VEAQNDSQPFRNSAAITDAGGRFELGGFDPRANVLLSVNQTAGSSTASVAGNPKAATDRTISRGVELHLKQGITLSGRVFYLGKPRGDVLMRLYKSVGADDDGTKISPLGPTMRTYPVAAGSAEAVAVKLKATFKDSNTFKVSVLTKSEILVYAEPTEHAKIAKDLEISKTSNGAPRIPSTNLYPGRAIDAPPARYFTTDYRTDADGFYHVSGFKVGDSYYFEIVDADGLVDPQWMHQRTRSQTVGAGSAEIRLPDVNLISSGQTLKGIVVDPRGQPIGDVTVSASLVRGMGLPRLSRGPPSWTKTDGNGRFEIRQLPDLPVELMAYRANPKGGTIRHPSRIQPKLNQQDIRIVLDPILDQGIEDLDAIKPAEGKKK